MPKKTKKEKILAQQRRQQIPSRQERASSDSPDRSDNTLAYTFSSVNQKKIEATRSENATELVIIKKDLLKTLILASIAIAVECILYMTVRK